MSVVESALRTRGRLIRIIKTRELGGWAVKISGSVPEVLSLVEAPRELDAAEVAREGVEADVAETDARGECSEAALADAGGVDIFRMYDCTFLLHGLGVTAERKLG